jgi:MFS family permease
VIFVQETHGLSLAQVTLLDVAFWIAATLGELPTGVVADTYGRKASLATGAAIMAVSIIAWALAPTVPLVVLSYITLAIGITFISGADDALFFETLKSVGRVSDYTQLVGRVGAMRLAAAAVGNVASGLLATIDLRLPFLAGGVCLLTMLAIILSFREPPQENDDGTTLQPTYGQIVRQAIALMRARPTLRYALLYITLIPIAAMVIETVFLQPQAILLGVPLGIIGVVVMGVQLATMLGSTNSHRLKTRFGEERLIYGMPFAIAASLLLLGLFQQLPALGFAAAISFFTALLRPVVMNRIQGEISDRIRATVLSMSALMFAFTAALVEPVLGYVADVAGLPVTYYVLAIGLTVAMLLLFARSRGRFP